MPGSYSLYIQISLRTHQLCGLHLCLHCGLVTDQFRSRIESVWSLGMGGRKLFSQGFVEDERQVAFVTLCLHNSRAWSMAEGYPGNDVLWMPWFYCLVGQD